MIDKVTGKRVADVKIWDWEIVGLGLVLVTGLVIIAWSKPATIFPYFSLSLAMAALLVFSIIVYYRGTARFSTIFLILLVLLFLGNLPFIATHYQALAPGDVTFEYAVINTFSQGSAIFVIPESPFSNILTWYSSWPLLHSLSLIFSDVLGIEVSVLPLVLPTIFSLIGFLFVYLLASKLASALKLNAVVVPLCLLFYAVSPEVIYYASKFVRQSLSITLVLIEFYLLYKYIRRRDSRILALIVLNVVAIVLVHHYTSFVFTAYLLAFAGLTFVLILISRGVRVKWLAWLSKFRKEATIVGIVGLLSVGSIFVGWTQVATVIQPLAGGVISRIVQVVNPSIAPAESSIKPAEPSIKPAKPSIEPYLPEGHYPKSLTPPWVNLLWVRDFLLYAPVFFGFAWLFREKLKKKLRDFKGLASFNFLVFSLSIFGVFFLFELFISHVEPYRLVNLSMPLIAFCSAIAYVKIFAHRKWLQWLAYMILVFIVTASFLGLGAHRYAPIHLYSSAVNAQEVGEPTPLDDRHYALQRFVEEHGLIAQSDVVFSDDNNLLYRLLPPQQYKKIGPGVLTIRDELNEAIDSDSRFLVADFNTNFYTYYWGLCAWWSPEVAKEKKNEYRIVLEDNLSIIYNDTFEVWLK